MSRFFIPAVIILLSITGVATARELPQGPGLAAGYESDQGIADDPAVVFAEDFEQSSTDILKTRWSEVTESVISFSSDKPEGSQGKTSLTITASDGSSTGGHLYKLLDQGYDQLFVRFYTKFPADHGYIHHFVRLRGWTALNQWPNGNLDKSRNENACGIDIEPIGNIFSTNNLNDPVGIWTLNAFWHEMRSWENEDGTGTSVYPDLFESQEKINADRERWYCVEAMVKLNSAPDAYDGEMALWIDGKLVSHYAPGTPSGYWRRDKFNLDDSGQGTPFEGMNWRPNEFLQLNRLWLLYYVSESAFQANEAWKEQHPEDKVSASRTTVYFDHVVLAREYIGPIGPGNWGSLPPGDYDGDGSLGVSDVLRLAKRQCTTPGSLALDFNHDGKVNIMDALALLLRLRT